MSCAAACFHSGYGGAEGEPPYLLTQGRLGQPGQRHGKGFAMVCTTLNFAEKYLLKTEVRSVAGMSGGTSDAGTDFDVDLGGEGDLRSDHATGTM